MFRADQLRVGDMEDVESAMSAIEGMALGNRIRLCQDLVGRYAAGMPEFLASAFVGKSEDGVREPAPE